MVKKMLSRLENRNTSPNRTGEDDIDEDEEMDEEEPQRSTRRRSASYESTQSNRANGGNDAMVQMMNMMRMDNERRDRRQEERDRRQEENHRREREERDRRQEELIVRIMQGHNGPQVTVAISPPKPFYGNEERDKVEFDEWIATVDDYVRQSGQDALTALKNALDGSAKEAYHAIPVDQRETYEDAVNRLRPLVRPVMSKNVAAIRLLELEREPGESVEAAMQRYLRLKNKTTDRHIVRASWLRMMDSRMTEKMFVTLGPDKDDVELREIMELTVTKAHILEDARSVTQDVYGSRSQTGSESGGDYREVISEPHKRKIMQRKTTKNINDNSQPGAFSSISNLYKQVQNKKWIDIKRKDVKKFLHRTRVYTLHKQHRKGKTGPIFAWGFNYLWEIDLADMQSLRFSNHGVRYLLVIIDSFSKFLRVLPIKRKLSTNVTEALSSLFSQVEIPVCIGSDLGGEFWGESTQELFKKDVYGSRSQTGSESGGDYREVISEPHKRKIMQRKTTKNINDNSYVIEEPKTPKCAIHNHCGHDTEQCFGILRGRQLAEENEQMRQRGNTHIKTTIPKNRRIHRVKQNMFGSKNSRTPPSADIRNLGANLKIAGQTFKAPTLLDTGTEVDVIPRFVADTLCSQRLARRMGGQRVKPALARGHIQSQTIVTNMQIDDGPRIEVSCIISEDGSSEVLISPETAQKLGISIQMVRCQPYNRRSSKAAGCVSPDQVSGGSWMHKPWSSGPTTKGGE